MPVEIQESPGLSRIISAGSGTLGDLLLAISFVPFLVYFMLTWKDHVHANTVHLFPKEHRLVAHRTVARISEMIRSFISRESNHWRGERVDQRSGVLAAGNSVFLFSRHYQRVCEFDSISGRCSGFASAFSRGHWNFR